MADDHLDEAAIAAHDRQRRLPVAAQRALVAGLHAHLHARGPCLDAGIGTGSVALPLVEAGIPIVGVDRSGAMLDALRAKAGGTAPLPLVRGDLLQLPFRTAAFGAALVANVFHLIPAWRTAVAELVRVVAPGGLLLVNLGSGGGRHGVARARPGNVSRAARRGVAGERVALRASGRGRLRGMPRGARRVVATTLGSRDQGHDHDRGDDRAARTQRLRPAK